MTRGSFHLEEYCLSGFSVIFFVYRRSGSGRLLLLLGAFASAVCLSIYTAGMASAIAATTFDKLDISDLRRLGYSVLATEKQVLGGAKA